MAAATTKPLEALEGVINQLEGLARVAEQRLVLEAYRWEHDADISLGRHCSSCVECGEDEDCEEGEALRKAAAAASEYAITVAPKR